MLTKLAAAAAGSNASVLMLVLEALPNAKDADRQQLEHQLALWVCRLVASGQTARAEALEQLVMNTLSIDQGGLVNHLKATGLGDVGAANSSDSPSRLVLSDLRERRLSFS